MSAKQAEVEVDWPPILIINSEIPQHKYKRITILAKVVALPNQPKMKTNNKMNN